ncbi:MAG: hypothetical protein R6V57_08225 [Vicinamibacterales bacterium]
MERRAGDARGDSPPARATPQGLARMAGVWLLAVLAAAAGLRVADAVPRVLLGVPRGVVRPPDLARLERESGRRMPMPAYFPDSLEWPPAEMRMHSGGSAAIWCRQRPAGGLAFIVATAPPGARAIAPAVLPAAVELQRERASLGALPASVSRVRDQDGIVWQQVEWQTPGQIILLRYRGTLGELLKIAGSVRE